MNELDRSPTEEQDGPPPDGPRSDDEGGDEKQAREIRKLCLEIELFEEELKRGTAPTAWEVVKTVVPWLSIIIAAFVFFSGYVSSLHNDRRVAQHKAIEWYVSEELGVGAFALLELATVNDSISDWLLDVSRGDSSDVGKILLAGIDTSGEAAFLDAEKRQRNLAAVKVLGELPKDKLAEELCEKYQQAVEVFDVVRPELEEPVVTEDRIGFQPAPLDHSPGGGVGELRLETGAGYSGSRRHDCKYMSISI